MRVGTLGEFVISANAILQGIRWVGVFKIHQTDPSFLTTSGFSDEMHTDCTFDSREEAIEAAFAEGEEVVKSQRPAISRVPGQRLAPTAKP